MPRAGTCPSFHTSPQTDRHPSAIAVSLHRTRYAAGVPEVFSTCARKNGSTPAAVKLHRRAGAVTATSDDRVGGPSIGSSTTTRVPLPEAPLVPGSTQTKPWLCLTSP